MSFAKGVRAYKRVLELEYGASSTEEAVGSYDYRLSGQGGLGFDKYLAMWQKELPRYQRETRRLKALATRVAGDAKRRRCPEAKEIIRRASAARTSIARAQKYLFVPSSKEDWIDRTAALTLRTRI